MSAGRGPPLGLGHAGLGLPVGTGASVRLARGHGCDEPLQYFHRGLRSATDRANSQAAARDSYGNGDSRAVPAARGNRGRGKMPSKRTDLEVDTVLVGRPTQDRDPDLVDARRAERNAHHNRVGGLRDDGSAERSRCCRTGESSKQEQRGGEASREPARLERLKGGDAQLDPRARLHAGARDGIKLAARIDRVGRAPLGLGPSARVRTANRGHRTVPPDMTEQRFLSLRPTGLADGLALKERRYSRYLREIRPYNLGPRLAGFVPTIGRAARKLAGCLDRCSDT